MSHKRLDYSALLLSRLVLYNAVGAGGVGFAWAQGWPQMVLEGDTSRISLGIAVLLAVGLGLAFWRGEQIGAALDRREPDHAPRLASKVRPIRNLASTLTLLGLIGTLVGFVVALSGVDQASVADPTAIGGIVATLMQGMGIALYTTLVGAGSYLWLMCNVWVLDGALESLRRGG